MENNEIMEAKAYKSMVRIAPRKVRLVLDSVRGVDCNKALAILKNTNKGSAKVVGKLILSAMANAEHNYSMNYDNLYIKEIRADEGATLKRIRARARGSASPINKRTSNITVIVAERN